MALTLSHGFVKPQTGDRGVVWFPALEGNIQKLNDHTHDGSNSSLISITALNRSPLSQSLLLAGWSAVGDGSFTRTVTTPAAMASLDINIFSPKFVINSGANAGKTVFLSYTRLTSATYTLVINEAVDLLVQYV